MKKSLYWGIAIVLAISLCGCAAVIPEPTFSETAPAPTATAETSVPTTAPTTQPTEPVTEPTEPATEAIEQTTESTAAAHSPIYHPDYTCDQIWAYFEEVALHAEYSDGTGNPALVQKWLAPLYYRISGAPTDEDIAILEDCFAQLNAIPGFPGIYPAEENNLSNLNISFLNETDFQLAFSAILNGEYANGATQFWYYNNNNELHTANIGYRTDIEQNIRSSILIEEIINTLGFSDTTLRTDSIVYQYSDENLWLSDVDQILLKLLYDPNIECGMTADQCYAVIRELYY